MTRVLVVGLAVTGDAVVRYARRRGDTVVVIEDHPVASGPYPERLDRARELGARVEEEPDPGTMRRLVERTDVVVPSPGVAQRHPVLVEARRAGVVVRSEVDLAAEHTQEVGGPDLVAITGTNGKTTVTTLVVAMLAASGRRAVAAGNIGLPLLDAVQEDVETVVAEVSSFQLELTTAAFRPRAAALLNVAEDHLDWHRTFDAYARAKAKLFEGQHEDDLLVFNADDPVVAGLAAGARARRVPFSVAQGAAIGFRVAETARGAVLTTGDDQALVDIDELSRRAPHDLANALAASALALDRGADVEGVARALREFRGLAHRLEVVGERAGVRYVDDSKATNVHATLAAVRGFEKVVLVAGGRNKGLDLRALGTAADRLRLVVAIGDAASDIEAAFRGAVPVVVASSMREAVHEAAARARRGDVVLLSPACASYDWFASYAERGAEFARAVRALAELPELAP